MWLTFVVFLWINVIDVLTTNAALAHAGLVEANPLMHWSQACLGAFWWVPKMAVAAGIAVITFHFNRPKWLLLYTIAVALAVTDNLINIRGHL